MPQEHPREPMPKSFRPFWLLLGAMVGVVVVIGLAAAAIALLVRS